MTPFEKVTTDLLVEAQLKQSRSTIGMAIKAYSPGETRSSSGALYVILGDYMWIYLGFTPCASVQESLKAEYNAVFGKIIPVDSCVAAQAESVEHGINPEKADKDLGFAYGTPFVGIPLPR